MRGMGGSLHVVSGPECIQQSEIEHLVGMQNQIRLLSRMYNQQCASILNRLLSGTLIEPGTHTAEIEQDGGTIRLAVH